MARPKPDHPTVQVHLYLPKPFAERMKAWAERRNLSMTKAVMAMVSPALDDDAPHEAAE